MDSQLRRGFRIGAFEIEPLTGRLVGPGGETRVQPKVMDVLVFLAERAGDLVERETLLDGVWGRATSEEVLTRCISELRSALGDERDSPRYIQTVPKRGYRLLESAVPKVAARPAVNEPAPRPTAAHSAVADAPVRPPLMMASIVGSTKSSFTAICNCTFLSKLTENSWPRYVSVCPFCRPNPCTSITVRRNTSTSVRAALTASKRLGWMMAMMSFMGRSLRNCLPVGIANE